MAGLYIFIAGVTIAFLSVLFILVSWAIGFIRFFRSGGDEGIAGIFCGQIGGMIGMVVGAFIAFIGALMGGWTLFQTYLIPLLQR